MWFITPSPSCSLTPVSLIMAIFFSGYNPCTPIEARQSSFSAALLVLLNGQTKEITTRTSNTSTKGGWLSCTRELRLISLQVCNDCRQQLAFHVRVDRKTPRSLLENRPLLQPQGASRLHDDDGGKTSRVLGVRATSVEWDRSIEELAQNEVRNIPRAVWVSLLGVLVLVQPGVGVVKSYSKDTYIFFRITYVEKAVDHIDHIVSVANRVAQ